MTWSDVRNNSWTDERVDVLKAMWALGESASKIAGALGGVSRNAVIGKVHRLGLAGRPNEPARVRSRSVAGGGNIRAVRCAPVPKQKPIDVVHADVLRVEAELIAADDPQGAAGCRWIIGDPSEPAWRFCQRPRGKRLTGGESMWCPEHHALGHHRVPKGRAA